jgi:hypothetical protein
MRLAWCGTATLEAWHCRTQVTVGGQGVFIHLPVLPNSLSFFHLNSDRRNKKVLASLSSPLVTLSSQASPFIFPSILERKKVSKVIREQIH